MADVHFPTDLNEISCKSYKLFHFEKNKFMAKQDPIRIINILELHIYFYDGHFKNIHSIKNYHA